MGPGNGWAVEECIFSYFHKVMVIHELADSVPNPYVRYSL